MKKLHYNRTELSDLDKLIKRFKLVLKMITAKHFVFIEITKDENKKTESVFTSTFNTPVKEVNTICQELYIQTIDVVYKDVSLGNKLIQQLHGNSQLTLCN